MSEIGDMYDEYHAWQREQKAARKDEAVDILAEKGVEYTVHNEGLHFVVDGLFDQKVDFWPTTGRWMARGKSGRQRNGYGVESLLSYIGVK